MTFGSRLLLLLLTLEKALGNPVEVFWDETWPSDTDGALTGTVLFAQAQITPSLNRVNGDDMHPHLTPLRKTLVMFRADTAAQSMNMTVRNGEGTALTTMVMNPPSDIPKQDGWIPGVEADLEFPLLSSKSPYVIQGQSSLNDLDTQDATWLMGILKDQTTDGSVEIRFWDGSWVRDIYLPQASDVPTNSVVFITDDAGYSVNVHYPNTVTGGWRIKSLGRGDRLTLVLSSGCNCWVSFDDLQHNNYIFGSGFWTAILEADWVQQGLTLDFEDESANIGSLDPIDVGGFAELIITTIDAGFLTAPRNEFTFQDDHTTHREYFQTIPASRMVVAPYEAVHFTEVMLPTGVLYTTSSADSGGWHSGDMRQFIGKILLSHGINLANYGISSSSGSSESSHPYTCALLTAHNTIGSYTNGIIKHGGSGGNGMITLDSSVGNEMSHEAGHNYGLGHYVRGFEGSVHRGASSTGSTWGWDSDLNVFVPNFRSSNTTLDMCCCPSNNNDQCEPAFLGKYQYGKDAMAGGEGGQWGANRYTLYTPNSFSIIQDFFESKAVFDPTSSTGFRKYSTATKDMEEFDNDGRVPRLYRVPVTSLVGYYDPNGALSDYIYPALHGSFGFVYNNEETISSSGCELRVDTLQGLRVFRLSTTRVTSDVMNKFHVNIAAEDEASSAEVYCNGGLRVSKDLNGPQQAALSYTIQGAPFTTPPVSGSPSSSPSASDTPSVSPTGSGTCSNSGAACSTNTECSCPSLRRRAMITRALQCNNPQECSNKNSCCPGFTCVKRSKVCEADGTSSPSDTPTLTPPLSPSTSFLPSQKPSDAPTPAETEPPSPFCGCVLPTDDPSSKPSGTPSNAPTSSPTVGEVCTNQGSFCNAAGQCCSGFSCKLKGSGPNKNTCI